MLDEHYDDGNKDGRAPREDSRRLSSRYCSRLMAPRLTCIDDTEPSFCSRLFSSLGARSRAE
jgi:hypothetical protein